MCAIVTISLKATYLLTYFPVQLATRLPDWSACNLLQCSLVLPVCPCVVSFSKVHEHDRHDLLRTSR